MTIDQLVVMLELRGVVTTDPSEAAECCGIPRDDDGFCRHRPYHPIYVPGIKRDKPTVYALCSRCGELAERRWESRDARAIRTMYTCNLPGHFQPRYQWEELPL